MTEAVLTWADGATAEVYVAMDEAPRQRLIVTGDGGELELPTLAYTAQAGDETELLVSDGSGTDRLSVPPANAYQVMVEEMSSVLAGGPGWLLPLTESRATAAVLDAGFASARAEGEPVAV
jgi:predicted dehydrogenase